MSETWNTLQVARDARLAGRADVAAKLYDEVAPDFVLGRCTSSRRGHALINWETPEWDDRLEKWVAPLMTSANDDGFVMRIGSYAQLIRPQWYGVFTGID